MATLDPGTMGGDSGWGFRIFMLIITIGGLIIVASLIGIISGAFDSKVEELRKGFLKLRRTVQERMSVKDPDELAKIASSNASPTVRAEAIKAIGITGGKRGSGQVVGWYASGDIGEMVLPELIQISKLTSAAVSLGVVDQDDILIVNRAQGDGHLLINMSVGSRLPIATSSAGWAYLAGLPAQVREEVLQKLKYQNTGKWTALRAAIESAAANLGTNGYVLNEGFYHPDVNAVAAPAFDRLGKPQYVVSCGGPNLKAKFMRDEVGPRISRLARKITVALAARSI